MGSTYTFTARSAQNPAHVATFTLRDDRLAIDIGVSLAAVEKLLRDASEESLDLTEAGATWLRPAAAWLVQRTLQPFSVADVEAEAAGESLQVKAWIRVRKRRLAPITFLWEQVDNPEASQAFVAELRKRQAAASRPGNYPGPLDYWGAWLAGAALAGLFVIPALRRIGRGKNANASQARS